MQALDGRPKPNYACAVLAALPRAVRKHAIAISVAAGVSHDKLSQALSALATAHSAPFQHFVEFAVTRLSNVEAQEIPAVMDWLNALPGASTTPSFRQVLASVAASLP